MWIRLFFTASACYSSVILSQEITALDNSNHIDSSNTFDYSVFDKAVVNQPTTNNVLIANSSFDYSVFDKASTNLNKSTINIHQSTQNKEFDYSVFDKLYQQSNTTKPNSGSKTSILAKKTAPENTPTEIIAIESSLAQTQSSKTSSLAKNKTTNDVIANKDTEAKTNIEIEEAIEPAVELTAEEKRAMDAYKAGRLLRAQFKDELALEQLKYAAELGNMDAQFLYGISLLTYKPSERTAPIAKEYLFKAVDQGHLRAMFEMITREGLLSREQQVEWEADYLEKIEALTEKKPSEGHFLLYEYYSYQKDSEQAELFFEQSVEDGHPQALFIYAQNLLNGDGLFLSSRGRYEEANLWLQKSAAKSYLPAYRLLIKNYEELGDYDQAFYWRSQLLDMGDLLSLTHLGKIFLGQSKSGYDKFIEKQQGLDYLALYLERAGTDRMQGVYKNVEELYGKGVATLTEEELALHQESVETHYNDLMLFNFDIYTWLTLPKNE